MSIIGKRVRFHNSDLSSAYTGPLEGEVLDKFTALTTVRQTVASGRGGTYDVDRKIAVDHYLVRVERGEDKAILTIKCSEIWEVI